MVGRGHTKETVGLLNINSIHLYPSSVVGHGYTKETMGLLNINSIHLYTLFGSRSWSYQRNCGVVKYKLYTFIHPLRY